MCIRDRPRTPAMVAAIRPLFARSCALMEPETTPASRGTPILAWIAARPGRAFAAFLGLHAAVWTALPTLLYPNLPLDLIEALIYGREWQLGYDKRQLVIAELPFAPVNQCLDQVERQIGVEQRRQRGPDRGMQSQEGGKGLAR